MDLAGRARAVDGRVAVLVVAALLIGLSAAAVAQSPELVTGDAAAMQWNVSGATQGELFGDTEILSGLPRDLSGLQWE